VSRTSIIGAALAGRERLTELREENARLRGLLERLIEAEGMIVFAAPGCSCADCELVLEIKKEVDNGR
jgi:hypothetical protein